MNERILPLSILSLIQQAGTKLSGYAITTIKLTAALFAHLSRLFTIRTASQTQNAVKATAMAGRRMVIRLESP